MTQGGRSTAGRTAPPAADQRAPCVASPEERRRRALGYAAFVVFVLCGLNVMTFIAIASRLGGDAVNGRKVGHHYFLAAHGKSREVSEAVYTYSLWHVRSLLVTVPLSFVAFGVVALTMRKSFQAR